MTTDNHILPSGMAMVGGKVTGLAGCADPARCSKSENCLRADGKLDYKAPFLAKDGVSCGAYIPVRRV